MKSPFCYNILKILKERYKIQYNYSNIGVLRIKIFKPAKFCSFNISIYKLRTY